MAPEAAGAAKLLPTEASRAPTGRRCRAGRRRPCRGRCPRPASRSALGGRSCPRVQPPGVVAQGQYRMPVVPSDRGAFHGDAAPLRLFGHQVHPAGGGFQVENGPSQTPCGLLPPAQASVMGGPQGRPDRAWDLQPSVDRAVLRVGEADVQPETQSPPRDRPGRRRPCGRPRLPRTQAAAVTTRNAPRQSSGAAPGTCHRVRTRPSPAPIPCSARRRSPTPGRNSSLPAQWGRQRRFAARCHSAHRRQSRTRCYRKPPQPSNCKCLYQASHTHGTGRGQLVGPTERSPTHTSIDARRRRSVPMRPVGEMGPTAVLILPRT